MIEVPTGSPLHVAVLCDQEEVIEFLLQRGADINVRADDENEGARLHWAAFFANYDMVVLLVEAEGDVNALDARNSIPRDAFLHKHAPMEEAIRDQIADSLRDNGGETGD